jgi:acetate kinase
MPIVLAFNPGRNSLKFDLIEVQKNQKRASQGQKLLSSNIDNVGRTTSLESMKNGKTYPR